MNSGLLETIMLAGSTFLLWHILTLALCVTGLVMERTLRRGNPHVRSSLLRVTLVLALGVPVACSIWTRLPANSSKPLSSNQGVSESASAPQSSLAAIDWDHVAVWRPVIADLDQYQDRLLTATRTSFPLLQISSATFLGVSFLVSLALLIRFFISLLRCDTLRRSGMRAEASEAARCRALAARMGVATPPVFQVAGLKGPLLLGFFNPVILVPDSIQARDEIYAHELTHLKRHDMWWHLFARLATILMPLQPGFWFLKKALARADEDVCDDMVLIQGATRSAYAELLLKVAESQYSRCPDLGLPMAAFRSQLEHRLHRLMDTTRPLASRLSLSSLGLCLVPLLLIGLLTVVIDLDAARPLEAEDTRLSVGTDVSPQVDYSPFLVHGSAEEKEVYTAAFKTADAWLAFLDDHQYANSPAPDQLDGHTISPQDWQMYLIKTYSGLGEIKSRQLQMVMRGWLTGADASKMTNLTLTYKTSFKTGEPFPAKAEQLQLSRDSEGKWRVREFSMPIYAFVNAVTMSEAEAKSQRVAALVDQTPITWADVDQAATRYSLNGINNPAGLAIPGVSKESTGETRRLETLQCLIDRELIVEKFKHDGGNIPQGMVDTTINDVVKGQFGGDRNLYLKSLTDHGSTLEKEKKAYTDTFILGYMRHKNVWEPVRKYYQDNPNLFPMDERINVSVIHLTQADLAQQILKKVKAGADFATFANKYPDLGFGADRPCWVTKEGDYSGLPGWMPITWSTLEKMQTGQTTDVLSRNGIFPVGEVNYFILRVNDRLPASIPSTDEAKKQKQALLEAEQERVTQAWLDNLRSKAVIQKFAEPKAVSPNP